MQLPGTGNKFDPDTWGKYMPLCSSRMTGTVSAADFDAQRFLIQIKSENFKEMGAVEFAGMPCPLYGDGFMTSVNTWVQGIAPPKTGYINIPTATFNAPFTYKATDGSIVSGTAEAGGNYGIAYGGELLVSDQPKAGQIVDGSAIGKTSCSDNSAHGINGQWVESTVDFQDRFGTAVNPVVTACIFEPTWGNVFCYEFEQYVGMIQMTSITLARNADGSYSRDADGNYFGDGWHYWAIRTDRLLDTDPNAPTPAPWTN
jgi:hypothetical protein